MSRNNLTAFIKKIFIGATEKGSKLIRSPAQYSVDMDLGAVVCHGEGKLIILTNHVF
jgi:hypothetical protein